MVKIRFFPVDIDYKVIEKTSLIYLYGKTDKGERICVVQKFEPYFYAEIKGDAAVFRKQIEKLEIEERGIKALRTEEVERIHLQRKLKLLKIYVNVPEGKNRIRKMLDEDGIRCYEHDLSSVFQYLRDTQITPLALMEAQGEYTEARSRVPVFAAEQITAASEEMLASRILSFDIETYAKERTIIPEKNPVLMLAFYGEMEDQLFRKVITWKRFKTGLDYIEFVESEEALIKKFKEVIKNYQPDLITGYFSDGFDFPYLQARAKVYGISLDLGLDYSELRVSRRDGSTSSISGIAHVDVYKFVKNVIGRGMDTESLSLNNVAKELLGYNKHGVNLDHLAEIWDERPEDLGEFCKYNLHDAFLNYELCVKLMPSLQELVKLIGLPLFEINRMSFSRLVENYILKKSREFNILAANKPDYNETEWRRNQTYQGGFVYEPKPGIYTNLAVFDFRSLYPSIIASHNVGPDTLDCDCCKDTEKVPGSRHWFCKKRKGFFAGIVEDLINRRMRIKEMIKSKKQKKEDTALLDARSYGLKTVANSFYGYMGFFAARWYCLECVQSITAYARNYIQTTMQKAEEKGFKVVYGDTDSLMTVLGDKSKEEALAFMEEVNSSLSEFMELEFEGFYPRSIFVAVKGGEYGAKKKYALFDGEKIKVVGFEAVRRNWSQIGKETQDKVLRIVLKEDDLGKALAYVQKVVEQIRKGEVDNEKMVIKVQLSRPLEQYTSIGPHVAVARKMKEKGYNVVPGMVISFIVGKGKGLVRERAKLAEETEPGDYDAEYYTKSQIIPAVNSIFAVLGLKEEDILKEKQQKGLGDFFQ